tara:strand:+ start:5733 stop:6716 length:984 start_codon:yes stop_codon:yes gene_type:complete
MYKFKLKENSEFEVGDVKVKDGKKSTVTNINPVTGAISWDIVNVGAFDTVYKTFDKLNKLLRTLESEGEAESDPTIDSITDQVKKLFNQYRTHVRKNYPEAYDRIRMVKEEEVNEGLFQKFVDNTVLGGILGMMWYTTIGTILDDTKTKLMADKIDSDPNLAKKLKTAIGIGGENLKEFLGTVYYMTFGNKNLEESVDENVDEGEGMGYLTPRAFDKNKSSTGAKDIYYYKLGFKPVPKKIKGSGLEVKQLFEKEELTEYSDFQQKRINIFDDVEEKINSISPLLSNAKNETAQYYNENPGSYTIVYSTDMVNELLDDITKLLKQGE